MQYVYTLLLSTALSSSTLSIAYSSFLMINGPAGGMGSNTRVCVASLQTTEYTASRAQPSSLATHTNIVPGLLVVCIVCTIAEGKCATLPATAVDSLLLNLLGGDGVDHLQ